ncbi:MAG: DUF748 domain-containing protein [bacterium]|nr:DUF748 domain-containing protein [bacterium]
MKRKTKKKILYSITSVIIFLIAVYFTITSNIFLTRAVVPVVGFLMDADFVVKHASYDPFTSFLTVQDVRLGNKNNPFITSKKASCNVNLFALITNRLAFSNIKIDGININFIKDKKGEWSIPWIYINYTEEDLVKIILDFPNVKASNMNLRFQFYSKKSKNPISIELKKIKMSSKHFVNGTLSPVKYKGKIEIKSGPNTDIDKGNIEGVVSANLGEWCIPSHINISSHITDVNGKINNIKTTIKNSEFKLDIKRQNNNINKYKINYINFTDRGNKNSNSSLTTNGIINFFPFKFFLNINANPIQSNMLAFINNLGEYNLGKNAKLKYSGKLDFTYNYFRSMGKLSLNTFLFSTKKYQLTRDVPLNFFIDYDFKINNNKNLFSLDKLQSTISDSKNTLLTARINQPFYYYLKTNRVLPSNANSKIKISTENLDLKLLNPFVPKKLQITNGILNSNLTLSVVPHNNDLNLNGYMNLNNACFYYDKNLVNDINITQKLDMNINKLNHLLLNNYTFSLKQKQDKISKLIIKGKYDISKQKGDIDLNIPYVKQNIISIIPKFDKKFPYISAFIKKLSPVNLKLSNRVHFDINTLYNLFTLDNFNFTIFNPKENTGVSFILNTPFSLLFKGSKFFVTNDIEFESEANSFNFKKIIDLMPKSFPIKLNNGFIKYKLLFILSRQLNSLKIKGKTELLYANLDFYGRMINNLSISNSVNAVLKNTQFIKLENCITEVYVNGIRSFLAKTDGSISFNDKINSHLTLSVENINKYILNLFRDGLSTNVKNMLMTGKINLDYIKKDQSTSMKGTFSIPEFTLKDATQNKRINGSLNFYAIEKNNKFSLNNYNFSMYDNREPLINLQASGNFSLPLNSGISTLNITSDRLAFNKVEKIYDALNKDLKQQSFIPKTEFKPINFRGLDLKSNIKFSNMSYGKLIKSNLNSEFTIKNNILKIHDTTLGINNTNIIIQGDMDTNVDNGYTYNLKSEFRNLNLKPIINTFVVSNNKKTKGTVNVFTASINGKGFTEENLSKHLTGKLYSELSDLSVPYQIQSYKLLKITLIPIEMLEQIRQIIPGGLLVNNLNKGIKSTSKIINNLNNINLNKGEIYLTAKDGKVNLNKVKFIGSKSDAIKFSNFSGTIGFDRKLDINSYSNISGLRLPFHIKGTIDNPSPNTATFLTKFLAINTVNILNPMNIVDILVDTGIGVGNTIGGTTTYVGRAITKPFAKKTSQSKVTNKK